MNAALMIAYGNLDLTKEAVASALRQDVEGGVMLWLVDNGSTDGTWEWMQNLNQPNITIIRNHENISPCLVSNREFATLFSLGYKYVFGFPNDVRLPSNCYSQLLRWPRGIVCATDIGRNEPEVREAHAVSENTPMAVSVTRKWFHEAIVAKDGYFYDPNYFHYASDCDLALRMAACGLRGLQIDTPYWHYGSASLKTSVNRRAMEIQADRDREYFVRKHGFKVDSLEYGQRPADLNYKG